MTRHEQKGLWAVALSHYGTQPLEQKVPGYIVTSGASTETVGGLARTNRLGGRCEGFERAQYSRRLRAARVIR